MVKRLNKGQNIGLVVGATGPEEMKTIRDAAPDLPFLIPGIGAQGGDLEASMKFGNFGGGALINVSRSIIFPGDLSFNAIQEAAKRFNSEMQKYL